MTLNERIKAARHVKGVDAEQPECAFSSLAEMIQTQAQSHGDEAFLIYYDENDNRSELSYEEFSQLAGCTAAYLHELGLQPGDRIATAAHNHPDTIIQYFGAWMAGMCVVPLNMGESDERQQYILANSGAKVLFCRENYLSRLPRMRPPGSGLHVVPVYDHRREEDDFHYHIERLDPRASQQEYALDDEALIVYTSGTTGSPKGVVLVQRNLIADAEAIADWHSVDSSQRMMCVLPVHHVNGTIVTHVTPFLAGSSVVLNRKFSTARFFNRIRREQVTIVSVVPTLLAFLLEKQTGSAEAAPECLRHIICGAGPLTCELARQFEDRFGIRIVHGYGLSETTCYSCFLPVDLGDETHKHYMRDFGFPSIGVALPVNEMAIHDPQGKPLAPMERGEIVARGSNVMKGYYNNEEANETAFAHSWFRSGDEGFYTKDDNGRKFYFITGRLKELIIRGGVNLAPLEIDEVLAKAPGVKAGIAVGFENNFYGEEVGALVIAEDEGTNAAVIEQYCAAHLPFNKRPKVILFADELPVTSTGKYQRNKVKHLFKQWQAVQFRP